MASGRRLCIPHANEAVSLLRSTTRSDALGGDARRQVYGPSLPGPISLARASPLLRSRDTRAGQFIYRPPFVLNRRRPSHRIAFDRNALASHAAGTNIGAIVRSEAKS